VMEGQASDQSDSPEWALVDRSLAIPSNLRHNKSLF